MDTCTMDLRLYGTTSNIQYTFYSVEGGRSVIGKAVVLDTIILTQSITGSNPATSAKTVNHYHPIPC